MAQLSAGAATEVIAAGGMDTSISKKKRRRNKKDRGLADSSAVSINASTSGSSIKPSNVASISHPPTNHAAPADRAKGLPSLPTALPPHLVASKKRKRAATPPSETHSDTGHLPNSLVTLQADNSSKSEQRGRKRRKQEIPSLANNTKDASSVQDTSLYIPKKAVERIKPSSPTAVDSPSRQETSSTPAVLAAAPKTAPANGPEPAAKLAVCRNEMQQVSDCEQQPSHEESILHPPNNSSVNVPKRKKKKKRRAERQQGLKLGETSSTSAIAPLLPARNTSLDAASTTLPSQDLASVASTSAARSDPVTAAVFTAGRSASNNASTSASTPDPQAIPDTEDRVVKVPSSTISTIIQAASEKPKQSKKPKKRQPVSKELTRTTSRASPERTEKNDKIQAGTVSAGQDHSKADLRNDDQLDVRISPARFDDNTQKSSQYSGGKKSSPSLIVSETLPSSSTSFSGPGISTQSDPRSSNAVRAPPSQLFHAHASQAELASSSLSLRIRLHDEESDTELHHFEMREYKDDDTNHTDDEDAGFYLPEPTDLQSSRRQDSSLLPSRSPAITPSIPSSVDFTNIARSGLHPRVTSPVKTTPTATEQPLADTEGDKSISGNGKTPASSSKFGKRILYTTPSRIMQNLVQGHAKATSGERLQVPTSDKASQAKPSKHEVSIGTSDTPDATTDVNATAPVASGSGSTVNDFSSLGSAKASNAGLGPALFVPKTQAAPKSPIASLRRPVVEIPVRRTRSPASPRKSLVKAPRQSFSTEPMTGASVALSSVAVVESPSPPIARPPTGLDHVSDNPVNLSVDRPDATPGPSKVSAKTRSSSPKYSVMIDSSKPSASLSKTNADLTIAPSMEVPDNQSNVNQARSQSQLGQVEKPAKLTSAPSPSPPSSAIPAFSPPAVTDAVSFDDLDAPPAEQVTSTTLLEQEVRAEPRIFQFLEDIQSDDSDSDSEDSSSSDDEDDQQVTGVSVKRQWPVKRARNASSSPEAASDESDEDSDTGPEGTGNTPAAIPNVRSLSPPVVQDVEGRDPSPEHPVQMTGITNNDNANESQILLEAIAQMVSSGEAKSKSLPEEGGSTTIEKDSSTPPVDLPAASSAPIVETQVSTGSPLGGLSASTGSPSGSHRPAGEDGPKSPVLKTTQDSMSSPLAYLKENGGAQFTVDNAILDIPESALGLTFPNGNTMSSEPFSAQTLMSVTSEPSPPSIPSHTSAPTNIDNNKAVPPNEIAATKPAINASTTLVPEFINSTSIPSPSRDAQRLYPCLSALDSEMSQPMFAALGSQSSPNGSDASQMDELEQTQLLPEKLRFRDFGPTPSPLQTGFDTASQIDELMQSSFDERSMIAAERHDLDAHNGAHGSDEESQSSRDSQSGVLPSSELPHQFLQDSATATSDDARMTSELDVESPKASSAADAIVPQPADAAATESPSDGEVALQPEVEVATASGDNLEVGSHASQELLSEPSSPTSSNVGYSTKSQPHAVVKGRAQTVRQVSADSGSIGTQTRSNTKRSILPPAITAMAIPSVLPRSNSISAISNRFQGKLAERRNSGPIPRVNLAVKATQQPPTQSADSSDESDDDDDSDSDSRVTPEQNNANKPRLVGLAALR